MLHDPLLQGYSPAWSQYNQQNKGKSCWYITKYSSNACVVKRSHVKSCIDFSHLCSFSFLPSEISPQSLVDQLKIPGGLFCRGVLRLVCWTVLCGSSLRQKYHQNGAVLSSLRPSGRCMISICLFIDDVPFDSLVKVVSPRCLPCKVTTSHFAINN